MTLRFTTLLALAITCSISDASVLPPIPVATVKDTLARPIHIIRYNATIEPNFAEHSISGSVTIVVASLKDGLKEFDLDCNELQISEVYDQRQPLKYELRDSHLHIELAHPIQRTEWVTLSMHYYGTPHTGIFFNAERSEVFTSFSTSHWMPCIDAPDDRATLELNIILPRSLQVVACGRLKSKSVDSRHRTIYQWKLDTPAPSYTYGFCAGKFSTATATVDSVKLNYLSAKYSGDRLGTIFVETPAMVKFFEEKSDMPYQGEQYSQALLHDAAPQEMSGFAVMDEDYGQEVLNNNHEVWLIAHELAHQWWGNMVTCQNWTHMWLNEGMATFMVAAFKEKRFGKADYDREINLFRTRYERVRDAGKDKSLVFPDWDHPTKEDRTIVYQKGAYVLYLLRTELGDADFWKGIKYYTKTYWGQSVTTHDFQTVMETATGKKLDLFFSKWVYMK